MKKHSQKNQGIRLIGLYRVNRSQYLYAYAYDGRLMPGRRKHVVSLCTGETDPARARAKAERFVIELKKKWK